GDKGIDAANEMLAQFGAIDEVLTTITRGAGIGVDLAGVELAGRHPDQGSEDRAGYSFFGSANYNKLDKEELAAAPVEFVRAWITEVSQGFDAELAAAASNLGGDTVEGLLSEYEALFAIR